MTDLTWVEIKESALIQNIIEFRKFVGKEVLLCPTVKANAYGHGLSTAGLIFEKAGADWLAVNSLWEARKLQNFGIKMPIYVMGYIALEDLPEAVKHKIRFVVYNRETIEKLGEIKKEAKVHIKVETGNNRQGVLLEDLEEFAGLIKKYPNIEIEGLTTHFANIEDTTDHSYAFSQLEKFKQADLLLQKMGIKVPIKHSANSAATILFPETHFQMVRTGLANYGMWPSNETYVSFLKEKGGNFKLEPAFTWKTKIAQIKKIEAGSYIGYGCTYKTTQQTRLAILPVGYYDGYDRGLSGAHVLIHGKRAPVRGRICMNITMVDVSDIPEASLEDGVVLIGRSGEEFISAEMFAGWAGTINYEVTTRVNENIPRYTV